MHRNLLILLLLGCFWNQAIATPGVKNQSPSQKDTAKERFTSDGELGSGAQALFTLATPFSWSDNRQPAVFIQTEKALLAAVKIAPNSPAAEDCLDYLAKLYREQGNYAKAEQLLTQSLALQKKQGAFSRYSIPKIELNLAIGYRQQNKDSQAIAILKRVLHTLNASLNPKDQMNDFPAACLLANASLNLGLIYEKQGNPNLAEPLYKQAMSIFTRSSYSEETRETLDHLALIYYRQNEFAKAEPVFEAAVASRNGKYDQSAIEIMKKYVEVLRQHKKDIQADRIESRIKQYTTKPDPSNEKTNTGHPVEDATISNAILLFCGRSVQADLNAKQYDHALKTTNKMIELGEQLQGELRPRSYYARAITYEQIGQYNKELEDLNKAISIDPQSEINYYLKRGDAYRHLQQHKKAIDDYTKVINSQPSNTRTYLLRAAEYRQIGEEQNAQSDEHKAITHSEKR